MEEDLYIYMKGALYPWKRTFIYKFLIKR